MKGIVVLTLDGDYDCTILFIAGLVPSLVIRRCDPYRERTAVSPWPQELEERHCLLVFEGWFLPSNRCRRETFSGGCGNVRRAK